jgi:hypothetical protein
MILLIILVVLAFVLFYLQSYFKMAAETQIIQTSLSNFHPDLLLEKQPIYVHDNIFNLADIISSIFKYQYVYKVLSLSDGSYLKKNLSRFVLLYNDQEHSIEVNIANPNKSKHLQYYSGLFVNKFYKVCKNDMNDIQTIKVILKPNNMIVLPVNWLYNTNCDGILEVHLFDCISRIYSFIA